MWVLEGCGGCGDGSRGVCAAGKCGTDDVGGSEWGCECELFVRPRSWVGVVVGFALGLEWKSHLHVEYLDIWRKRNEGACGALLILRTERGNVSYAIKRAL